MTDRERWTVYPLLFLALASSLKDKLVEPTELDIPRVRCQELVVGVGDHAQVQIAAQDHGGRIVVANTEGKPLVVLGADSQGVGGALGLYAADGHPLVIADGVYDAGRVATFMAGLPRAIVAADSSGNGAFGAYDQQARLHPMLVHRGAEFVRKPQSPLYEIISPFNANPSVPAEESTEADPETDAAQAADQPAQNAPTTDPAAEQAAAATETPTPTETTEPSANP
jgi:hypothetical protein